MNTRENVRDARKLKRKKKARVYLIILIVILVAVIVLAGVLYSRYDYPIFEDDYACLYEIRPDAYVLLIIVVREDKAYLKYRDGIGAASFNEVFAVKEIDGQTYLVDEWGARTQVSVSQYKISVEKFNTTKDFKYFSEANNLIFEREGYNIPPWLEKIAHIFFRDIFRKVMR